MGTLQNRKYRQRARVHPEGSVADKRRRRSAQPLRQHSAKTGREHEALDAYKKSLEIDANSDEIEHVQVEIRALESKLGVSEEEKKSTK